MIPLNIDGQTGRRYAVGLDLGGTKLAAALFSQPPGNGAPGCESALENSKYADIIGGGNSGSTSARKKAEAILAAMVRAVKELCGAAPEKPSAAGVCSAGFVENGVIVEAWNTGMKNFPLQARLEAETGIKTFLYKDSWAPVFALRPDTPSVIFSIGTGFGGISCDPGPHIPIRSFTTRKWPLWIPHLYSNDDPGYSVSFSPELSGRLIARALERQWEIDSGRSEAIPADAPAFAARMLRKAAKDKRITPSKIELFIARRLAPWATAGMGAGEIFADWPAGAHFPSLFFQWLTGRRPTPEEMDELVSVQDAPAMAAFNVHAEFIGYVLYRMQRERAEFGLAPAMRTYGTGSGFNPVNHGFLSDAIAAAAAEYCEKDGLASPAAGGVELIKKEGLPTTFACLGAATGALMGVE